MLTGVAMLGLSVLMPHEVYAAEINNVTVTIPEEAIPGQKPISGWDAIMGNPSQYEMNDATWYRGTSANISSMSIMSSPPYTFEAGKYYSFFIYITPKPGYTFADTIGVSINNQLPAKYSTINSKELAFWSPAILAKHAYGYTLTPPGNYTFPSKMVGYSGVDEYSFVVQSTSTTSTKVSASLSGSGAEAFNMTTALPGNPTTDITLGTGGGKVTFRLSPKTGLAAGTYNATVAISGPDVSNKSFNVSFTVNSPESPTLPVVPAVTYNVTVHGGSTNKVKPTAGEVVTITANAAPEGKMFDQWITADGVIFADANNAVTTFVMPDKNVAVEAIFKDLPAGTFAINVLNNGNGTASANVSDAKLGEEIFLTAEANEGYHFVRWLVTSGNIEVISNRFIMPEEDVTIEAIFESDAVAENEDEMQIEDSNNFNWLWILFVVLAVMAAGGGITFVIIRRKDQSKEGGK